jgi:hypothetical protein
MASNEVYGDTYFAAKPAEETVSYLTRKSNYWFETLTYNRYLDKLYNSWSFYHGVYFNDHGHQIIFDGEQGELVELAINHFRNIAQNMLVMVTSNRPSFQARSVNTDKKSLIQTNLANSLLDYYMREKRLERYLKKAVEYAIVMGTGYLKMDWNSNIGEEYDFNEELGIAIKEGDVVFRNLSPLDVVFDSTKNCSDENEWVICRTFKNKYDFMALYPDKAKDIQQLKVKSDYYNRDLLRTVYDETTDIPVYEFYHKRTESMPDGRYMLYLDDGIVLIDTPMPYRNLPIYRISPSEILGTQYGYTTMFDLMPAQEAINSLYSTILTNQNAFGVQNIYVERGSDVAVNQLQGALNIIEGNPGSAPPQPLNLTQTPPEIFNFINMIEKSMEIISGVNSVARGDPQSSLKSGNALALIQAQALQFISGLQQSYIQLIEDVGTGLIKLLQDYASVPRVAAIVGKNNRTEMKEFKGDDLDTINRVIVDVGNALANTAAGRAEIANNLLQMKPEEFSVEQYLQVMTTGNLNTMTEDVIDENMLIRSECEALVQGSTEVRALAIDKHTEHIKEHKYILSDPELRKDLDLVQRTLAHIQEHINLLRETDPALLTLIGQQPLSPVGGTPPNIDTVYPGAEAEGGPALSNNPQAQSVAITENMGPLPEPAEPARPPGGGPIVASEIPLAR